MRILHVIPSLSPKRGGPSFAIRAMTEAIAHWGAEVHIATTDDDDGGRLAVPLEEPIINNGVTVYYFRRQTRFYTVSWPLTRWLWGHVGDYDLVHIHSLFSYSTLPAAWFAYWQRVPYIVRPLGHLNQWGMQNRRAILKRLSLNWIESPLLQRAALLHFTCEQERIDAEKVEVNGPSVIAPLGIDTAPFQQLPFAEEFLANYPQARNKVRILFLARIDRVKGLNLLLAAFAQLRQSSTDTVLVIAGDGELAYLTQLKALAKQLNIADAVIWVGFLTGQAKLAVLAAANFFVLPSYSENFGIAVVEAMAAGLPVIISDQVGIHHEVDINKAGLIIECTVASLALALGSLVENAELRKALGCRGRQAANELFSQQAMTQGLIHMYESVLATKNGQPT